MNRNGVPKRVWIDVTTMLRWHRPVVGVVRVEEQLARFALGDPNSAIRFCCFDRASATFRDVEPEHVAEQIAFYDGFIKSAKSPSQAPIELVEHRVRDLGFGLLSRLPPGWKVPVRDYMVKHRPAFRKLLARANNAKSNLGGVWRDAYGRPKDRPSGVAFPEFDRGDVYVSVGGDWDDKDLPWLYRYKRSRGFKVVGMCYDTIPIKFPHLTLENTARVFPRYLADLAWVADHVMCISACTQRDFLEFVSAVATPAPRTSVIRLGNTLRPRSEPEGSSVRNGQATTGKLNASVGALSREPFVLFVSTIEKRKNHEILYKVWLRLIEAGYKMPHLVFVGMRGWGVDELLADLSRDQRVRDRIHILHDISDAELACLYERCLYTLYPSLYEGWGLPVVESLAFGKFCLCSNAGSLTEAGGELSEYLDPWDLNAWTAWIRYFVDNPEEIEKRNRKVALSFKVCAWKDTSAAIMHTVQELLREPGRVQGEGNV